MFDDVRNVENGSIVRRNVGAIGEEEVATCSAASLWFAEVAGVAVARKNHVASIVGDDGSSCVAM